MQCNIDSRGKAIRLIMGLIALLIGLILGGLLLMGVLPGGLLSADKAWILWTVAGVCVVGGGFGIFEARAGWCVVRAMGLRTPF